MDVEAARTAALQVLAGGGVGAAWGALSAYLKGLPVPFFVSAYGVNAAVFTAAFLGAYRGARAAAVAHLLCGAAVPCTRPPPPATCACRQPLPAGVSHHARARQLRVRRRLRRGG